MSDYQDACVSGLSELHQSAVNGEIDGALTLTLNSETGEINIFYLGSTQEMDMSDTTMMIGVLARVKDRLIDSANAMEDEEDESVDELDLEDDESSDEEDK